MEEEKYKKQLEAMAEHEKNCAHIDHFTPVAQQVFYDKAKGVMILISTIVCTSCGHLFFDTQDTNITPKYTVVNPKTTEADPHAN
ncbi:MAG TPA: hypothetical protein VNX68_16265 [Nitrosopumilaceae archaeon]|jgi:hypothetical protein|nr:hypothetical protein [Nitrosopumilaceae archaeon]